MGLLGQLCDALLQRVGPVRHRHTERALQFALVKHGEMWALHRTGKLLTVARLYVARVAAKLADGLGKVEP